MCQSGAGERLDDKEEGCGEESGDERHDDHDILHVQVLGKGIQTPETSKKEAEGRTMASKRFGSYNLVILLSRSILDA